MDGARKRWIEREGERASELFCRCCRCTHSASMRGGTESCGPGVRRATAKPIPKSCDFQICLHILLLVLSPPSSFPPSPLNIAPFLPSLAVSPSTLSAPFPFLPSPSSQTSCSIAGQRWHPLQWELNGNIGNAQDRSQIALKRKEPRSAKIFFTIFRGQL